MIHGVGGMFPTPRSHTVIVTGLRTNGAEAGLKESGEDDGDEQRVPLSAQRR